MTARECTASSADLENTAYLYPVISSPDPLHIAEEGDDYGENPDTLPKNDEALVWVLKQGEIRALTTASSGQVGRLYRLANLLINSDPIGRPAEDLEKLGLEVRNAASILEETLYAIVGPIIDDPEPDEDEIAD
jgi:hypothetical protein